MLDATEARQIGRRDLFASRTPSPEPLDEEAAGAAAATYQQLFGAIETVDVAGSQDAVVTGGGADDAGRTGSASNDDAAEGALEEEYEFRLFSSARRAGVVQAEEGRAVDDGVQKLRIQLRSPSPALQGEGSFVAPFRGWEYYLSGPVAGLKTSQLDSLMRASARRTREFRDTAVSAHDIAALAQLQHHGCHLSWRVLRLNPASIRSKGIHKPQTQSGSAEPSATQDLSSGVKLQLENPANKPHIPKSRKKPGKKRRIVLRSREAGKKQAEEAEREKRTARNREKKLKRRQREREKKAATAGQASDASVENQADELASS
ncbi:hypothetical protein KEM52_000396 [Ascosphaera acerosa]|nr:hypothetical protein KEM52_000396 [Ascosphaera acerosa]